MIERLKELLKDDRVTFSVLYSIIQRENQYLESDYENYIICYSEKPYPVWLWTKEDISDDSLNEAIKILTSKYPLSEGFTYNMRKQITDKIPNSNIETSMISYVLNELNDIDYADGKLVKASIDDLEILTDYMKAFHKEIHLDLLDNLDEYREKALNRLQTRECYFFENSEGEKVALTILSNDNDHVHISYVYTVPKFRKMGYAETLVHFLCKKALENNLTPTLYADEYYAPSNNCYKKLGFEERGLIVEVEGK